VWRHSYKADYAFYDIDNKREIEIPDFPKDGKVQYITWSPTEHKLVGLFRIKSYAYCML